MNPIQGALLVNGRPRNGVTVKLWKAEAFTSPPVYDAAEPTDVSFQVGGSIVTGTVFGVAGAYRFTALHDGSYYVSLNLTGKLAWDAWAVGSSNGENIESRQLKGITHEGTQVGGGDDVVIADVRDAGVVRYISLAMSTRQARGDVHEDDLLQVYVNNEAQPSINTPLTVANASTPRCASDPMASKTRGPLNAMQQQAEMCCW